MVKLFLLILICGQLPTNSVPGYLLNCYLLFCDGEGLVLEFFEYQFGELFDEFGVFEDVFAVCFGCFLFVFE